MPRKPCPPNCQCGLHSHTKLHNYLIGRGVHLANERKRKALAYRPRNEISDRFEPR